MDKVVVCRVGKGWTYVDSGKAERLEAAYSLPQYKGYRVIDQDKLHSYLSRQGLLLAVDQLDIAIDETKKEAKNSSSLFSQVTMDILISAFTSQKERLLKLLKETE